MSRFKSIVPIFFCFLALSLTAKADLVVNGGFETGDLTGWTDGGNTGWNGVCSGCAHTGTYAILNGAFGSESLLFQTITTVPGESYNFSAWFANEGTGVLHLYWDGSVVATDDTAHSFTQFAAVVTATSASTIIAIGSQDDENFVRFDDVSVNPITSAVPEPSTFGLAVAGLLIPLIARRRRRKAN